MKKTKNELPFSCLVVCVQITAKYKADARSVGSMTEKNAVAVRSPTEW